MFSKTATTPPPDLAHTLREEELAALKTAAIGRSVALAVIAPLVTFVSPWPGPLMTYVFLLAFGLLGWGSWWVARSTWGRRFHQYAFVSADFILLTVTLLAPNPLIPVDYPPQIALRFGTFVYFFVLLAGLAYVYQPRLVIWGGISGAVSWIIGVAVMINLPGTFIQQGAVNSLAEAMAAQSNPTMIDLDVRLQEVTVLLVAAGLLALAVARSRAVALRQVRLARERENLGRYFPRKTAQLLADRSDPFPNPSEASAAVLFADLVAFTSWSEKHSPQETIHILREVHSLLTEVVFRNNGTLDKFIGDGVMATFGTPEPGSNDASDALAATVEIIGVFEDWQEKNGIQLAVGVHYGPVVVGNIGSKERLEFAVLGDTVNVASRLESATRTVGCRALVSDALVTAARSEATSKGTAALDQLTAHGTIGVRGRDNQIVVHKI